MTQVRRFTQTLLALLSLFALSASSVHSAASVDACAARFASLQQTSVVARYLGQYKPYAYGALKAPIGIEVEGVLPEALHFYGLGDNLRGNLARSLPNSGVKFQPEIRVHSGERDVIGGKLTYRRDNRDLTITLKHDGSIQTRSEEIPFEIVSDKLERDEEVEDFLGILDYAGRMAGARAEAATAGVHVHVDFKDPRPAELALLSQIWSRIDSQLRDAMKVTGKPREKYARPFSEVEIARLNTGDLTANLPRLTEGETNYSRIPLEVSSMLDRFRDGVAPTERRYQSLNLESLKVHGTVEFRLMNSNFDAEAIRGFARFAQSLVMALRTQRPELVSYLRTLSDTQPIEIDKLMTALGITAEEGSAIRAAWARTGG